MSFASNYRRWMMEFFRPFVGRNIVEVGAGTGVYSELLLAMNPDRLTVLEPSFNLYSRLREILPKFDPRGVLDVRHSDFPDVLSETWKSRKPDTAVYINVLEHISNDNAELQSVYAALPKGGRILIFVPAMPFLMSRMDRGLGHFRRYTLRQLEERCRAAGFSIRLARYFDAAGILPWWIKYRVLQSETLEASAVRFHDRFIVPFSRTLERVVAPPFGKNIIMVGEK